MFNYFLFATPSWVFINLRICYIRPFFSSENCKTTVYAHISHFNNSFSCLCCRVRAYDNIWASKYFIIRMWRFMPEYIKACSCNSSCLKSRTKVRFINDFATTTVNNNCCLLHHVKFFCCNHVTCCIN